MSYVPLSPSHDKLKSQEQMNLLSCLRAPHACVTAFFLLPRRGSGTTTVFRSPRVRRPSVSFLRNAKPRCYKSRARARIFNLRARFVIVSRIPHDSGLHVPAAHVDADCRARGRALWPAWPEPCLLHPALTAWCKPGRAVGRAVFSAPPCCCLQLRIDAHCPRLLGWTAPPAPMLARANGGHHPAQR